MIEVYRGSWVVAYRELLRFIRDRSRIAAAVIFPLLFLAIFGAGFTNVVGPMTGGVDLIRFMYPGLVAMALVTSSLAAGISVVTDREEGFLREILVAPLSRIGIVLGRQPERPPSASCRPASSSPSLRSWVSTWGWIRF